VGSDVNKTRTAVLISADDYKPLYFGDQAYDIYADNMMVDPEGTKKKMLLFDHFKMSLSNEAKTAAVAAAATTTAAAATSSASVSGGSRRPMIAAATGELVPADKVFGAAFSLIHKSVYDRLRQSSANRLTPQDITWVITVPTLWDDSAKQIMREAARQGFPETKDTQIKIALEPEAAALCCRAKQLERQLSLSSPSASLSDVLKAGSNMIVADLGAGTADFSELAVTTDGTLRETAPSSGGPWGGHLVEKKMWSILDSVFQILPAINTEEKSAPSATDAKSAPRATEEKSALGASAPSATDAKSAPGATEEKSALAATDEKNAPPVQQSKNSAVWRPISLVQQFKQLYPVEYYELERSIRNLKHRIDPNIVQAHRLPLPYAFVEFMGLRAKLTAHKLATGDIELPLAPGIHYNNAGYLKLSHDLAMSLFDEPKKAIVEHLRSIFKRNRDANVLFLVGGFAESRMIQQAVDDLLITRLPKEEEKKHAPPAAAAAASTGPIRVLPAFPGLCVMNGAVHYGLNPCLVSERIAKKSYGMQIAQPWDGNLMGNREKDYRMIKGKLEQYCSSVFSRFCEAGDVLSVDHKVVKKFKPACDRQEHVRLVICESNKKDVRFTDDPSIRQIGAVVLKTPMPPRQTSVQQRCGQPPAVYDDFGFDRDIVVSFCFGNTEISISAYEAQSGEKIDCAVDCLDFDLGGNGFFTLK
jgi:hypothetical protein